MEKRPADDLLCFVCDNPLLVVFLLVLLVFAGFRLLWPAGAAAQPAPGQGISPSAAAPLPGTGEPLSAQVSPSPAGSPAAGTTPLVQPSATPIQPVFSIVFIPVNWQGNLESFRSSAQAQAQTFADESGLQTFVRLNVILSDAAMTNQDLTDSALVDLVQAFALEQGLTGQRYVGLTNADLAPEGMSGVVGWTSGGQSLVVEVQDPYVTAHELGHTFGLCDEYNFQDWSRQNREYAGGCPNPYPSACEQTLTGGVTCDGQPAADGSHSIMGPAGLLGDYSYNGPSLQHLRTRFLELAQ